MTRFVGNPLRGTNFSAAGDEAISTRVDGENVARFRIDAGGRLTWSDGTNAGDTILYRDSADLLKTDDVFQSSAGIVTLTTSGTPTTSLADGAIAIDTTNDKLFFRSSSAWTEVSGGGANVTISDTAPSSPAAGDLWFDSTSGDIYIYYGSQWVDVGGDSVANIAVQSTAPSSPVNGDLWFDTDNGNTYLYYDDGTSGQWVGVGSFPNPFPNDVVFDQNAEVGGVLTANHIHGNLAGALYLHVKNTSGVTIPAGSPVYATGSVGASGETEVAISDADNASTMPALGVIDTELANNAEGHAIVLGVATGLDTSGFAINDKLYVSTSGGLTNVRPTGASELVQKIARVIRSDASTGIILVGAGRSNDVPNNIVAGGLTIDTDTLHVDATNGRVGIGTTSPATTLEVAGAAAHIRITDSDTSGTTGIDFYDSNGAADVELEVGNSTQYFAIKTAGSEAMRIDSSGNVGINDTTPSYRLDVNGDINATGDVRVAGNPVGMVLVKSQTVGSGVSSVTVTNAFSSTFQNYKIIIDGVDSTVANNTMQFNFDGSTTGYYWAGWYRNFANTVGTFSGESNGASWPIGYTSTSESTYCSFEVFHPYDSSRRAHYSFMPGAGNDYVISGGGQHANVSSFTGFRIVGGAGTMTGGTIRVYGYNNG